MRRGGGDLHSSVSDPSLPELLTARLRGSAVVMGIGNPNRGDDSVGSMVARLLMAAQGRGGATSLRVIDAEEVPEAFLGPITQLLPGAVILVDAVDMGEAPGTVALLEVDEMAGRGASTHNAPLSLLAHFLWAETGADVFVLGIQPGGLDMGALPSPEILDAARAVALLLEAIWARRDDSVPGAPCWRGRPISQRREAIW